MEKIATENPTAMVKVIALHPASEMATDAATLDGREVKRVSVPDDLEKGLEAWLKDTLSVEYVCVEAPFEGWVPIAGFRKWPKPPNLVHARLFDDEPGGLPKKQRMQPADLDAREKAFKLDFQNSDNVSMLHRALTRIMQKGGYAPSAGLFQSSGWGKSRLVCEMWKKDVWVVYCSFAGGSGYPQMSWIAKWFCEQAMKHLGSDESLQGQLACMNFTLAYFIACIRVLANGVKNSVWSHEQFLIETMKGSIYWKAVQEETNKLLEENFAKGSLRRIQDSKELTWTLWEKATRVIFEDLRPENVMMGHDQKLEILFVFDEARHLVRNDKHLNYFVPIRRATRAAKGNGVLVLFMDTSSEISSSEISNFSAPDWADPSDRVGACDVKLAPPIWGTFSADISEKDSLQLFSTKTLNNIAHPHWAVRYGRPLWWATFKSYLPDLREGKEYTERGKGVAFMEVYSLARDKLLGGSGKWDEYIIKGKGLPEEAALTLLGATIGLDVDPRSKLASKLVANHLLSVLSVSPTRELVWTAWSSEPLVSMAAAEASRILNRLGRSRELYGSLVNALAAGWIDRGFTGELVAKIILLHAKNDGKQTQTVDDFCKRLVGKPLSELIGRTCTDAEKTLANARLHFNSFRRIYKKLSDMTFDDFLKCAERGCAIQCVAGAWGVDLLIFAFTGGDDDELTVDNVTVIYVQVKLREKEDATNVTAAKASPHYARLSVALKLPYMSLYMNVFDKGDKARAYWVDPMAISASVEASASKPLQTALKEIAEEQEMQGSSKESDVDLMEIGGDQGEKKGPAVQAWKAWLKARGKNLQTVLVVKGLEAFVLDEGLKDQLKLIVKTSRSPFFTDDHNDLHEELLELQKSGLQEMFKIENFWNCQEVNPFSR